MLYNFYVIDARLDEEVGVIEHDCADDEDALWRAAHRWAGRDVEVWSEGRLVARLRVQTAAERPCQTRSPEPNRQPTPRRHGRTYGK